MAQVVATRSIHSGSFASPSSGSLQNQVEKLKPSGFSSRVLIACNARKNQHRAVSISNPITARRSARAEPEVIPVSPEDVPKVVMSIFYFSILYLQVVGIEHKSLNLIEEFDAN